jgi:arabinose-5-phosphate isomerase
MNQHTNKNQIDLFVSGFIKSISDINVNYPDKFFTLLEDFDFSQRTIYSTGVGASSIPAQSFSHALASIGIRATSLEVTELLHGGLGRVHKEDLFFAFSNSGNTSEIRKIFKSLQGNNNIFLITSDKKGSKKDKLPEIEITYLFNNLTEFIDGVPSSSILAQLITAFSIFNYIKTKSNRAINSNVHPSGDIGLANMKVLDLMQIFPESEIYNKDITLEEAIKILDRNRLGIIVLDLEESKFGIFTDGDLRRILSNNVKNLDGIFQEKIANFVNASPKVLQGSSSIIEAIQLFETGKKVLIIPVLSEDKVVGVLHVHDILGVLNDK